MLTHQLSNLPSLPTRTRCVYTNPLKKCGLFFVVLAKHAQNRCTPRGYLQKKTPKNQKPQNWSPSTHNNCIHTSQTAMTEPKFIVWMFFVLEK